MDRALPRPLVIPRIATWPFVTLVAVVLVLLRRPFHAEFLAEEAGAFYLPLFFDQSVELVLTEWGGFLYVLPRLAFLPLAWVPPEWAPLAENLIAVLALAGLAGYVASRRMASVIPDQRLRIGLAFLLVLLPAQSQIMGTTLHLYTFAGLWLLLLTMNDAPEGRAGRWTERTVAGLASLSGPFSIVFAPIFVLRRRWWLAGIVGAGALVQLAVVLGVERTPHEPYLDTLALLLGYRLALVPLLGEQATLALRDALPPIILIGLGWFLLLSLAVAARHLPRVAWPLVVGALLATVAGFGATYHPDLWNPLIGGRYFYLGGVLAVVIVAVAVLRRSPLALFLAPVLAVGVVTDFLHPEPPRVGWAHECIGRSDPCRIEVYPPEWSVTWPGEGEEYVRPPHPDAS